MRRLGFALAVAIAGLDQATKAWIVDYLVEPGRGLAVTGFFNLVYVQNRGISFGMFRIEDQWGPWLFGGFGLAIAALLVVWIVRAESCWVAAAVGAVLGGAIGNILDRVFRGAVVDFLDFHAAGYHWFAFNVADAAISVGVGLLIVISLFGSAERTKT